MADDTVPEVREFDVGGVRLPRPFRIRRLGHFGVNVLDMEAARHFYCDLLGFRISDPIDFVCLPRSVMLSGPAWATSRAMAPTIIRSCFSRVGCSPNSIRWCASFRR